MDQIVLNWDRSGKPSRQDDFEPLPPLHQRAIGPSPVFRARRLKIGDSGWHGACVVAVRWAG
jgi:hypothetical protein